MSAVDAGSLIREARACADKATPGPWSDVRVGRTGNGAAGSFEAQICNGDGFGAFIIEHDGSEEGIANTIFVAAARTDVPALCDLAEEQAREIERLRAEVERFGDPALLRNLEQWDILPGGTYEPAFLERMERIGGKLEALCGVIRAAWKRGVGFDGIKGFDATRNARDQGNEFNDWIRRL